MLHPVVRLTSAPMCAKERERIGAPVSETRMSRSFKSIAALFLVTSLGVSHAHAADPQDYKVTIVPTGEAVLDTTLNGSAQLVTLQGKVAVPPFALVERARSD